MLEAFRELGYTVDLVTGYSLERKESVRRIKENIKNGKKYDFVYSESSTMPTILTDPHHFPLRPLLDWSFFKLCKKSGIPIGLFYRDIYWRFDEYGNGLNRIKLTLAKLSYRFDLWVYKKTLNKLFLPSLQMGRYVPYVSNDIFKALPPGHSSGESNEMSSTHITANNVIKLFYVGGMSNHYQMHVLFDAVRILPNIELTVCTRKDEWHSVKNEYPELTNNIRIVHLSGVEMEQKLKSCDIAVLFVKPQEYWQFASPVKLYEYLGFQKPILSSVGTLAGQFVSEQGLGWSLPYEVNSVTTLLTKISDEPSMLTTVRKKLQQVAPLHTWQARAQEVIKELTQ